MSKKVIGVLLAALMVVATTWTASAVESVPTRMNYQAALTQGGEPVTATVNVTFRLYDVASNGTSIWEETQSVTPDQLGRINVQLGSVAPLDASAFAGSERYLGIEVETDGEMTPRTALASSSYSFKVGSIDGAKAGAVAGNLIIQGDADAVYKSGFASEAQLVLVGLTGDSIILGPTDQVFLRAVSPVGDEYLSAILDPGQGTILAIRDNGGNFTEHKAMSSTYYGDNAAKGAMAFGKRMETGIYGSYLFGDSEADTIWQLKQAASGNSEMIFTEYSAAKALAGNRMRLGSKVGGTGLVLSFTDDVGNTLMETSIDDLTNEVSMDFYNPSAAKSMASSKTVSITRNGVTFFGASVADTTAILFANGNLWSRGQAIMGQNFDPVANKSASGPLFSAPWSTAFGFNNDPIGDSSTISGGFGNVAISSLSTIGGGANNTVGTDHPDTNSSAEVIGGGYANYAVGWHSTIGGGLRNMIWGEYSAISGGSHDSVFTDYSVIGGGHQNIIRRTGPTDRYNAIGGGAGNVIDGGTYSTIAGGSANAVTVSWGTIGGGSGNTVMGPRSTIAGGFENTIDGSECFIGGGWGMHIAAANGRSVIVGGINDTVLAQDAAISGGSHNVIQGAHGSTIGGGTHNRVLDAGANVIGGGENNTADHYSTISGGTDNSAIGEYSVVSGGRVNAATGIYSTIIGGGGPNKFDSNYAQGAWSVVLGGARNGATGDYALAAGSQAKAQHTGSFVWGSSDGTDFASERAGQFRVRADGGARFDDGTQWINLYDDATDLITTSTGAHLTLGGAWTNASDRNLKENFRSLDRRELLEKIAGLNIEEWNYKVEGSSVRHIGPTAQDFYALFGLGTDDKSISSIDPAGVALAAIQELHAKTQKIDDLQKRIEELERLISQLIDNR